MKAPGSYPNRALCGFRLPKGVQAASLWYRACRRGSQVVGALLWKLRVLNRHHEPARGSAIYICNHQSFLDPVLMGLALRRPMHYMARDSLFRSRLLAPLMKSLNAFPVRRGTADLRAMKEAMRRLKGGAQLVVFAEGTRTHDGRIGPFLPGVALLAQRAAEWTVPVVIDGAFEAWPRSAALFRPGAIVVQYGRPVSRAEARGQDAQALLDRVRREMIEVQSDIRRRLGREPLHYDDPPPAAEKG